MCTSSSLAWSIPGLHKSDLWVKSCYMSFTILWPFVVHNVIPDTKLCLFKAIITARKRSLGQGNIFAPVCHSVHRERGVPPLGRYIPRPGTPQVGTPPRPGATPWTRYTPQDQVHPLDQVPPHQVHPLGPGIPPNQVNPHPRPFTPPPATPPTPPGPGTHLAPDKVHPLVPAPPQAVHTGRYGQQVGGMHPTRMHSCKWKGHNLALWMTLWTILTTLWTTKGYSCYMSKVGHRAALLNKGECLKVTRYGKFSQNLPAQSMNQNVLRQLLETLYRRVIVRPVYHLGMFFEHPAGRTLTSDWLKNTFTLVVYEKIFWLNSKKTISQTTIIKVFLD